MAQRSEDDNIGLGLLGALGGFVDQVPLVNSLMRAGRSGLLAARQDRENPGDTDMDAGEAFLGVGPDYGWKKATEQAAQATGSGMFELPPPTGFMAPLPAPGMHNTPVAQAPLGGPGGLGIFSTQNPEELYPELDLTDPFGLGRR